MEIIERIRHTPLVARNTTGRTEQRTHLRWGEKGATRRLGGSWGYRGAATWGVHLETTVHLLLLFTFVKTSFCL
jgi:hypothetical protein